MNKFLVFLALGFLVIACKKEKVVEEKIPLPPISKVFASYYQKKLLLNPLQATFSGDHRYNDQLALDISQEFKTKEWVLNMRYQDTLDMYEASNLTEEEQLSRDILKWEIGQSLKLHEFEGELMPVNQLFSLPLVIGQLGSGSGAQPFKTAKDYDNWLARLDKFTVWCDTAVANMRRGINKDYVLPKSLIKKVIPQLESLTASEVEENIFFTPVTNMPENLTEREKKQIRENYTAALELKVLPKLNMLLEFMKTDYMEAGRTSSGVDDLPNGEALYRQLIEYFTTTDMTPDEIHKLGLQEVDRITGEMEKVKEAVGFKGTLKEFFEEVRTKKELMPFKKPEQVLEHFQEIHERIKPNLEKLFDMTPKTAFEIRRTEAFREASASAQYNPGSLDGSRPGIFYVPIPDVTSYNIYSDEDLFLHEAIPGHHYQISLQQENESLPEFRKTLWYSAYGEGWALYTESLGKELGLYEDPYQYFGMLSAEMHRAIRLVVDTGLHAKGWTREQAIQYSLDHEAESEAGITSEVERYMAIPGQALSYKIGQIKILELRASAEKELGAGFDIRQFHNEILRYGCLPLKLLEEKVNTWIQTQKNS